MIGKAELFAGVPYLSWKYLVEERGISARTVTDWAKPGTGVVQVKIAGRGTWYEYATIPPRSLPRLPWKTEAELRDAIRESAADQKQRQVAREVAPLLGKLQRARDIGFTDYRPLYLAHGPEKARAYAKEHSVWAALLQLKAQHSAAALFAAYAALEPNGYKSAASFGNALRRAAAATSLPAFVRHGNEGNQHAKTSLLEHEYWVRLLVSMGKGYEAPYIYSEVNRVCAQLDVRPVGSVSWVKHYLARPDVRFDTDGYRYGLDYARKNLPYLPLESALFANDQWQIDGWLVPFYHVVKKDRAGKTVNSFQRLVLFAVRDAHSRKVLGYAFGESENTALILQALRMAVDTTGKLPAEIVSDNHSFNQTKEAAYLKDGLADLGTTWTVTMNPQHKAIIERYFNVFDERFCKPVQGWVGGSPLNRKQNARPKQEVKDELAKGANARSRGEVIALVTHLLEEANAAPLSTRRNQSPNACYAASEQPNAHAPEATDVMALFWKTTRCTVRRGGVTLEKGGQRHYYPLPDGDTQRRWYQQEVVVRYDDDFEMVQLSDPATGALICLIDRAQRAHGAKANQHGQDMGLLSKQGHLLREIEQTRRQENAALRDRIDEQYGEIPYELLGQRTAPKGLYQSAQTAYQVGQVLKAHEVDEELLVPVRVLDPLKGTPFSRTARKPAPLAKAGPLHAHGNLQRIDPNPTYEDD